MMPSNEKAHGSVAVTSHEVLVGVYDGLVLRMVVLA
jgi:hypothetical protein